MASRYPRKVQSASAGGSPTVGVLVVDNDQSVRSVLRDVLTDEFMMFEASDAMEALQKSRSVQPTAILVDLSLPGGIDGQAFIQLSGRMVEAQNCSFFPGARARIELVVH